MRRFWFLQALTSILAAQEFAFLMQLFCRSPKLFPIQPLSSSGSLRQIATADAWIQLPQSSAGTQMPLVMITKGMVAAIAPFLQLSQKAHIAVIKIALQCHCEVEW